MTYINCKVPQSLSVKMFLPPLVILFSALNPTECAKILGIFPIPSLSHQIVYQPIWKELSLRGHQVTVVTSYPLNDPSLINLTEIDTFPTYEIFRKSDYPKNVAKDNYAVLKYLWAFNTMGELTLEHFKAAESVLNNPKTEFDLIIAETHSPLIYTLACRFKAPMIGVSSLALLHETHDAVGNPTHPVITPDFLSNLMEAMTFYDKVFSVLQNLWYRVLYYWYYLPRADKIVKKFGYECPYLGENVRNVSLIMINTNPLLHFVRPNVRNMIEMEQLHISAKPKNLPQDLQGYLDASTQGVIYLSLGSNVRSIDLSPRTRRIVSEALSELPYNALWKWENDSLPNKPKNVMIKKWFPQQDLLRHKNIKVFITQGGLQSMEEAITNRVPMIALPFAGDQPINVMKMVSLGVGRAIDHIKITKEGLKEAILDCAENDRYRQNMKGLKDVFSDHPMSPLKKIIWWIEHVVKYKGARHLRSPSADFSWFEYYFADVIVLLLFALTGFAYLLILCSRIVVNMTKR